jgi:AraC family transcriptional regulator
LHRCIICPSVQKKRNAVQARRTLFRKDRRALQWRDSFQPHASRAAFRIARVVHPRATAFAAHTHVLPHLVIVFDGEWEDRGPSGSWSLSAGELLFHPAGLRHANRAAAGTELIVIELERELVSRFCSLYGDLPRSVLVPLDALEGVPERLRAELLRGDAATPYLLDGLVMQLLALGSRVERGHQRSIPDWLAGATRYIREHLGEHLTAERIAKAVGVSSSHLAHAFPRATGRTLGAYIRECRVHEAARALRRSEDSIGEIALSVGFYDQAHLSRAFKAQKGVTPREYRRRG